MDIQTLKLDFVSKIINTEKPDLLVEISKIFQQKKAIGGTNHRRSAGINS
jgi:hypothetical protein